MGHTDELEDLEAAMPEYKKEWGTGVGAENEFYMYAGEILDPDKKEKDMGKAMPQVSKSKVKTIDSLNKRAQQGKGDMIDTERYGMVSWEQGEPDEDSFFAIDQDGESIELDYDEIVRFHNPDEVDVKGLKGESINLVREFKISLNLSVFGKLLGWTTLKGTIESL